MAGGLTKTVEPGISAASFALGIPDGPLTTASEIKPKALVMGLLFASRAWAIGHSGTLDVVLLLKAGEVFGIQANAIRVCLTRLVADGEIECPARGAYYVGEKGQHLMRQVAGWSTRLDLCDEWRNSGDFLAVHLSTPPGSDRKTLQQQRQALEMWGFRQWRNSLYVRPDNLRPERFLHQGESISVSPSARLDILTTELRRLGLPESAAVFRIGGLRSEDQALLRTLWDLDALDEQYRHGTAQLQQWLSTASTLPLISAAKESWLLGASAIRSVVYDPLLPDNWVDTEARRTFVETVKLFDRKGKRFWREYLGMQPRFAP